MLRLIKYRYFSFLLECETPQYLPAHKIGKLRGCAEPLVSLLVISKETYLGHLANNNMFD